jgi:hypothetical protein
MVPMSVRQVTNLPGVAPPAEPIAPLPPESFVARLNALSAAVTRLAELERA